MAEPLPAIPDFWHQKRLRQPPPPVCVAYRMAYVATIALHDEDANTIETKTLAATADEGPVEMMERLGAELLRIVEERSLPIVVVQDGAPELWGLVEEWLANFNLPIEMKLIDRYHVDKRLAQVVEIIEPNPDARRRLLGQWRAALDRSNQAISRICEQIQARLYVSIPPEEPDPQAIRPFGDEAHGGERRVPRVAASELRVAEGHHDYCARHSSKMKYAAARRRHFLIGSGVTEGACKSIAARFKRSGQRWFELGASACLHVRTMHLNGRLQRGFEIHVEHLRSTLG